MAATTSKVPTMEDVARAAGCHASTVSLALRGDVRIPGDTRERVQAAADRLGYRIHPLIAAWDLRRSPGGDVESAVDQLRTRALREPLWT